MKYRLGIDMGSNSIGWALSEIDKNGFVIRILGIGSRIFDNSRNPKSNMPLSVEKRIKSGMATRRDRFLLRQKDLCEALRKSKLMPEATRKDFSLMNPYRMRALGVKEDIGLYGLGRALFHINQRRGFKSNRKEEKKTDADSGAMAKGIDTLKSHLNGRTLGEFLYERNNSKIPTRMRASTIDSKNTYDIYADREMYEDEFNRIWDKQSKYHKCLTAQMKEEIYGIIFRQRKLKIPEIGWCQLERLERRAYAAFPISQKFRIYQEVCNLEVDTMGNDAFLLTPQERDIIAGELLNPNSKHIKKGSITFAEIRKLLWGTSRKGLKFNLEKESRKGLKADSTAIAMSLDTAFGKLWGKVTDSFAQELITHIMHDDEENFSALLKKEFGFSKERIDSIWNASLQLEDGTVSLSSKAMAKILPFMRDSQMIYNKACSAAGYNFNAKYDGVLRENLPYYGEILTGAVLGANPSVDQKKYPEKYFGKITNPTVHVALNQLRKVVNKIIQVYGKPDEIVVEVARELPMGALTLADLKSTQSKNRKENERIGDELKKLEQRNSYINRMKFKIWEDLASDPNHRCCPFCGKKIPQLELFTSKFQIEHLLPYSITFDDSRANKVISCQHCNQRLKGNKTPYQAFASDTQKWSEIMARASLLHPSKQKRFKENALDIFKEENGDMIARMLNDTRYMSKVAREYLTCILDSSKVYTVSGTITGMLRGKWKLDDVLYSELEALPENAPKNREDHRHHAIDAFVLTSVSRAMLGEISHRAALNEEAGLENVFKGLPLSYKDFDYEEFKKLIDSIYVSHKLDRGDVSGAIKNGTTIGRLHKETPYGKIEADVKKNEICLATREKLENIKFKEKDIKGIAHPKIRADILDIFKKIQHNGVAEKDKGSLWKTKLKEYSQKTKIQRVRIHFISAPATVIPISDKNGNVYKYMGNDKNYCVDIYKPSSSDTWKAYVVNMFEAHNSKIPMWRKNDAKAKLIMRLYKKDCIRLVDDSNKVTTVMIKKFSTDGSISYVPLSNTGEEFMKAKGAPALQKANARKIYIDEIGRVYDPLEKQKA